MINSGWTRSKRGIRPTAGCYGDGWPKARCPNQRFPVESGRLVGVVHISNVVGGRQQDEVLVDSLNAWI